MELTHIASILATLTHESQPEEILAAQGASVKLRNGDTIFIEWKQNPELLFFYSRVMDTPSQEEESFYQMLLNTHLFGKATQNTFFGIDEESGKILLYQTHPLSLMDEVGFFTALDIFAAQLEHWSATLPQLQEIPPSSSACLIEAKV